MLELGQVITLARHAAQGKRRSREVAAFLLDIEANCLSLLHDVVAGLWYPGPARAFRISDPKPRLISALPFRDRVVQHALMQATLPLLERSFAPQSYACRVGFFPPNAIRPVRAPDESRCRMRVGYV